MKNPESLITPAEENIIGKIYQIRGLKIMLDYDLAELYGVETRRLNEQVKRNRNRFPEDFMFQLTQEEFMLLISQNATSNWGGRRKPPFAFTEYGVLMLSSVLNSEKAIAVNIRIMRIFARFNRIIKSNIELNSEIEEIKKQLNKQNKNISLIFELLDKLIAKPNKSRNKIGYKIQNKD